MNIRAMNREGLTLIAWLLAAGIEDVKAVRETHIESWKAGDDPCKAVRETHIESRDPRSRA